MARYEFVSGDGDVIERDYAMADAPEIGKRIRVRGKTYRRKASTGTAMAIKGQPHLAHSQPRQWTPGLAQLYDKWSPLGVAAIDGAADQRRFEKALRTLKPQTKPIYDP